MSNILGKKLSVMRFGDAQDNFQNVTDVELVRLLNKFAFRAEGATGMETAMGFASVDDPYAEGFTFITSDTFIEDYALFLFRIDSKKPDNSAIKREYEQRIRANKGRLTVSDKKELRDAAKLSVLSKTPYTTVFVPVMYSPKSRLGYFMSTSQKVFDSFEALFGNLMLYARQNQVSLWENTDVSISPYTFLTWVWWRSESNQLKQVRGLVADYEISIGSRVSLLDSGTEGTVTTKESINEARIAVSSGKDVSKIDLNFYSGNSDSVTFFSTNIFGELTGVVFMFDAIAAREDISVRNSALLLTLKNSFALLDALHDDYVASCGTAMALTKEVRNTWSLGNFCSKAFDNI